VFWSRRVCLFLSVCVQHKSKSSEQIAKKCSEKVSNDKICNCTVISCTLLIGYHLVPRYSESLAVPPKILNLGGRQKKLFSSPKLCAKFPPMAGMPDWAGVLEVRTILLCRHNLALRTTQKCTKIRISQPKNKTNSGWGNFSPGLSPMGMGSGHFAPYPPKFLAQDSFYDKFLLLKYLQSAGY